MSGYCEKCGNQVNADVKCECAQGGGSYTEEALTKESVEGFTIHNAQDIGPLLPKPSTPRRLLGSGIEYFVYTVSIWVIAVLDLVTGGILGFFALVIVGMIVLRDFNAGKFSISKRISNMRVVDWKTGRTASNVQALLRNSYYLALPLLAAFLPAVDAIPSFFFMMFITLDIMLILSNHQGRRLGDFLAGTQVVEARI